MRFAIHHVCEIYFWKRTIGVANQHFNQYTLSVFRTIHLKCGKCEIAFLKVGCWIYYLEHIHCMGLIYWNDIGIVVHCFSFSSGFEVETFHSSCHLICVACRSLFMCIGVFFRCYIVLVVSLCIVKFVECGWVTAPDILSRKSVLIFLYRISFYILAFLLFVFYRCCLISIRKCKWITVKCSASVTSIQYFWLVFVLVTDESLLLCYFMFLTFDLDYFDLGS